MQMTVGKAYYERLLDYDFYDVIGNYKKDVLIIHGDRDNIVPLSYSERAVEVYPLAELIVIAGAGHGFMGEDSQTSVESVSSYLSEHSNVNNDNTTQGKNNENGVVN